MAGICLQRAIPRLLHESDYDGDSDDKVEPEVDVREGELKLRTMFGLFNTFFVIALRLSLPQRKAHLRIRYRESGRALHTATVGTPSHVLQMSADFGNKESAHADSCFTT